MTPSQRWKIVFRVWDKQKPCTDDCPFYQETRQSHSYGETKVSETLSTCQLLDESSIRYKPENCPGFSSESEAQAQEDLWNASQDGALK